MSIFTNTNVKVSNVIYVLDAEALELDDTATVWDEDERAWNYLSDTEEFTFKNNTTDDTFNGANRFTGQHAEEDNPIITSREMTAKVRTMQLFFYDILFGRGTADTNGNVPKYKTTKGNRRCWVKREVWKNEVFDSVEYDFADVTLKDGVTENNKYIRPTVTLRIIESANNVTVDTTTYKSRLTPTQQGS